MSTFTNDVARGTEGLTNLSSGHCPGCETCRKDLDYQTMEDLALAYEHDEIVEEPSFSWYPCDCCGTAQAGDRYAAHGLDHNREVIHLEVCVDCVLYLANGQEPEE